MKPLVRQVIIDCLELDRDHPEYEVNYCEVFIKLKMRFWQGLFRRKRFSIDINGLRALRYHKAQQLRFRERLGFENKSIQSELLLYHSLKYKFIAGLDLLVDHDYYREPWAVRIWVNEDLISIKTVEKCLKKFLADLGLDHENIKFVWNKNKLLVKAEVIL